MANHASAEKRHRQNIKRRDRNRSSRSEIRTWVKSSLKSAKEGDLAAAQEHAKKATRLLDKAVVHGLLHKNNAARRISRLQRRIVTLAAQ